MVKWFSGLGKKIKDSAKYASEKLYDEATYIADSAKYASEKLYDEATYIADSAKHMASTGSDLGKKGFEYSAPYLKTAGEYTLRKSLDLSRKISLKYLRVK